MRLIDVPPIAGVEHRDVNVNGTRLHVAQAGEGPPLILLHGWPQHWWCWRHLIPRLAENYRLLAPDLRGWGWSDAPRGDYAKRTFAADVLALMDAERIDRARIIGHDWGGYTAFLLALEHPDRIERMVGLDIPPPWGTRPRLGQLPLLVFLSYQLLLSAPVVGRLSMTRGNGFIRAIIRAGSGPEAQWSNQELDLYAEVLRDPARARASSACYRTFLTRELPGMLGGGRYSAKDLAVPALLLMGAASPLRLAVNPRPRPNPRLEWIQDAGHFLPEEAPERVLELALPFLEG